MIGPFKKAKEFEGRDIQWYIDHPEELRKLMKGIIDDELTRGRIRTIYVRLHYGHESAEKIAKYYKLPVRLIEDIGNKKIFKEIIGGDESYE